MPEIIDMVRAHSAAHITRIRDATDPKTVRLLKQLEKHRERHPWLQLRIESENKGEKGLCRISWLNTILRIFCFLFFDLFFSFFVRFLCAIGFLDAMQFCVGFIFTFFMITIKKGAKTGVEICCSEDTSATGDVGKLFVWGSCSACARILDLKATNKLTVSLPKGQNESWGHGFGKMSNEVEIFRNFWTKNAKSRSRIADRGSRIRDPLYKRLTFRGIEMVI